MKPSPITVFAQPLRFAQLPRSPPAPKSVNEYSSAAPTHFRTFDMTIHKIVVFAGDHCGPEVDQSKTGTVIDLLTNGHNIC